MNVVVLLCLSLFAAQPPQPQPAAAPATDREQQVRKLIAEIAQSGRALQIGEQREQLADPRRTIAPGAPPLLAFRYFVGADRGRFSKLDLMLDDAGH